MTVHDDWATPTFDLPPAAPRTGPFPGRPFLRVWWEHRGRHLGELRLVDTGRGLLPLVDDGVTLTFCGEGDLTDYHSPLGPDAAGAVAEAVAAHPGRRFRFDSLPPEAVEVVTAGLALAGITASPQRHTVAAIVDLAEGYEGWLRDLGKKQRHEVRRKRRRFRHAVGEPTLVRAPDDALDEFFRLHRRADGEKGRFMTSEMEAFFTDLHERVGAVVDLLVVDDRPLAAAFAFEDAHTHYLYNSAYDPSVAHASPGIVLLSLLMEAQSARGATAVDFLKGDEGYKFRLAARPRPLYVVAGAIP